LMIGKSLHLSKKAVNYCFRKKSLRDLQCPSHQILTFLHNSSFHREFTLFLQVLQNFFTPYSYIIVQKKIGATGEFVFHLPCRRSPEDSGKISFSSPPAESRPHIRTHTGGFTVSSTRQGGIP
jgi:hypothetical protein